LPSALNCSSYSISDADHQLVRAFNDRPVVALTSGYTPKITNYGCGIAPQQASAP
jgi:hypothetical protein